MMKFIKWVHGQARSADSVARAYGRRFCFTRVGVGPMWKVKLADGVYTDGVTMTGMLAGAHMKHCWRSVAGRTGILKICAPSLFEIVVGFMLPVGVYRGGVATIAGLCRIFGR